MAPKNGKMKLAGLIPGMLMNTPQSTHKQHQSSGHHGSRSSPVMTVPASYECIIPSNTAAGRIGFHGNGRNLVMPAFASLWSNGSDRSLRYRKSCLKRLPIHSIVLSGERSD